MCDRATFKAFWINKVLYLYSTIILGQKSNQIKTALLNWSCAKLQQNHSKAEHGEEVQQPIFIKS